MIRFSILSVFALFLTGCCCVQANGDETEAVHVEANMLGLNLPDASGEIFQYTVKGPGENAYNYSWSIVDIYIKMDDGTMLIVDDCACGKHARDVLDENLNKPIGSIRHFVYSLRDTILFD